MESAVNGLQAVTTRTKMQNLVMRPPFMVRVSKPLTQRTRRVFTKHYMLMTQVNIGCRYAYCGMRGYGLFKVTEITDGQVICACPNVLGEKMILDSIPIERFEVYVQKGIIEII